MAQFFTADEVNQRVCGAEQRFAAKANGNEVRNFTVREACHLLRTGDHRAEIVTFKVAHARPADDAAGQMRSSYAPTVGSMMQLEVITIGPGKRANSTC